MTQRPNAKLETVVNLSTNAKQIIQPEEVTNKLAYITGCWIANASFTRAKQGGNYGSIQISSNNEQIQEKYSAYMEEVFGLTSEWRQGRTVKGISFHSSMLYSWMEANGIDFVSSREKSIPEYILRSSPEVHAAFLSGYASCDSSFDDTGIQLCTGSALLGKQLRAMLLSLGIVPRYAITEKCATNGDRVYRKYANLIIKCDSYVRFVQQIKLDKECKPSKRTGYRNKYADNDQIPFLTKNVNEFVPKEDFKLLYQGRKSSRNKEGHMARNTLDRIDRKYLPEDLKLYADAADQLYFHKVTELGIEDTTWVYDLTVEGSHSFLADGFAVHNTVMAIAAAVRCGYRTCIIADQKDFLDGFDETIEALTNLPDLEENAGKKLYGFPKTQKDYETFQIALVTYQSLIKDSKTAKARFKAIQENYGTVIVDEAHRANAHCFSSIMANVGAFYRFGLTATPKRKDGKHYIIRSVLGPVVASTDAEALQATYCVHRTTKTVYNKNQFKGKAGWTRFCQFLARHPDRNERILDFMIKDLEQGRSIAVPVMFTDHAKLLVKALNEHFGYEIAATFLGGSKEAKKRKETVDRARAGEIRAVVGIRRLIQIGINIPQWDTLYYIMPMNNEPNWEQESFRILTPLENKKIPIVRLFMDERMERSVQCFRAVVKFSDKFGFNKAPLTPKKLRDWLGVVDRDSVFDDDLPDYVDPTPAKQGYRSIGGRSL